MTAVEPDDMRARTAKGAQTREELARVATDLFIEQGYEQTSVQQIARAAGMTTGAIYAHFPNKAGLLAAAISAASEEALRAIDSVFLGHEVGVDDLVLVAWSTLVGPASPMHRLLVDAASAAERDPVARERYAAGIEAIVERVLPALRSAHARGEIALDPDGLASLFRVLIAGTAPAKTFGLPQGDPDVVRETLGMLLRAGRAPSDAGASGGTTASDR
jgi:AcrR family transcriptional regulator